MKGFRGFARIAIQCGCIGGFFLVAFFPLYGQSTEFAGDEATFASASPETSPEDAGANATTAGQDSGTPPVISAEAYSFGDRLKDYGHSFVTVESLIGPAMGAGIGQARNTPHEWGQGGDGYGLRFASGYGRSVISRTISLGFATADGEDSRFQPSNETGVWRRTRHAIVGTFVSRRVSGGTMPAYSRFAGSYSAAFIANAWEPPSQDDAAHALERGSTAMLSSVGWHVFEEFWPDMKRLFHH